MLRMLFVLVLALAGTADAGSFSLVPTSSVFISQGGTATFDVWYAPDPSDPPVIAVNLRLIDDHSNPSVNELTAITVTGTTDGTPFDTPSFGHHRHIFQAWLHVNIGGSQEAEPLVLTEPVRIGDLAYTILPGPGHAGQVMLKAVFPQTGARDANFQPIPVTTPDVLATIHVPEPGTLGLLLLGAALLRRRL